jgi:hypothetical protein
MMKSIDYKKIFRNFTGILGRGAECQVNAAPRNWVDLHIRAYAFLALLFYMVAYPVPSIARRMPTPFTGTWSIDLRTPAEKKEKFECGTATFKLAQTGTRVVGDHSFATARCGRVNEGGEETVKGVVVGGTAVLVVTSGRNGGIVLGSATIRAGALHWQVTEQIKPGEPDDGLILYKGVLQKESP